LREFHKTTASYVLCAFKVITYIYCTSSHHQAIRFDSQSPYNLLMSLNSCWGSTFCAVSISNLSGTVNYNF